MAPTRVLIGELGVSTLMVVWRRRMGHGWRPCNEMAASMFLPTFAVIAMMAAGALTFMTAMMLERALMLPAMLLRYEERSCGHAHHGHAWVATGRRPHRGLTAA